MFFDSGFAGKPILTKRLAILGRAMNFANNELFVHNLSFIVEHYSMMRATTS
jgi:hypothetical protein